MTDEPILPETINPISNWLGSVSVPKILLGPAGEAISRLVAGATDIPVAFLERIVQDIRNKTEGRKQISSAISQEVSALVVKDADLLERAKHSLVAREYRCQDNKEKIAKKTIEILEESSTENADQQPKLHAVDPDWMNIFEKFAQDASTEKMQMRWAKILAGEIKAPTSFSLKTLRFVSELDAKTGILFENISKLAINGSNIPSPVELKGSALAELMHLESSGLLFGAAGVTSTILQPVACVHENEDLYSWSFFNQDHYVEVFLESSNDYQFPTCVLTDLGQELLKVSSKSFDHASLLETVSRLPKQNVRKIICLGFSPNSDLWTKADVPKPQV